jgi:hypothetical protein
MSAFPWAVLVTVAIVSAVVAVGVVVLVSIAVVLVPGRDGTGLTPGHRARVVPFVRRAVRPVNDAGPVGTRRGSTSAPTVEPPPTDLGGTA